MSHDDPAAVEAWTAFLDEMERGLSDLSSQLIAGAVVPALQPFAPPAGMPPLPRSLAKRAGFVLERTRTVEVEVAERAEAIRRHLAGVEQRQVEKRPVRPAFFDAAM